MFNPIEADEAAMSSNKVIISDDSQFWALDGTASENIIDSDMLDKELLANYQSAPTTL